MKFFFGILFFFLLNISAKPPQEVSVKLQIKLADSLLIDSLGAYKILERNFKLSHIAVHQNSPLILQVDLYHAEQMYVSKLAADLVRMEIKAHIKLFDRDKPEPYYSFDAGCKAVEEGLKNAQLAAVKSLLMDERELDLLSKKIKEIWGKEFY